MTAGGGTPPPAEAERIIQYWFAEAGPKKWFKGGPDFDQDIRTRFSALYEAAVAGRLDGWRATPEGALALILILDQFSRNMFRNDARAFASDAVARTIAREAIARGFDNRVPEDARPFIYMPFMHSEDLADQDYCVALFRALAPDGDNLPFAILHRDIIARFGRFPHRNETLGRPSTPEEEAYLASGGFRA